MLPLVHPSFPPTAYQFDHWQSLGYRPRKSLRALAVLNRKWSKYEFSTHMFAVFYEMKERQFPLNKIDFDRRVVERETTFTDRSMWWTLLETFPARDGMQFWIHVRTSLHRSHLKIENRYLKLQIHQKFIIVTHQSLYRWNRAICRKYKHLRPEYGRVAEFCRRPRWNLCTLWVHSHRGEHLPLTDWNLLFVSLILTSAPQSEWQMIHCNWTKNINHWQILLLSGTVSSYLLICIVCLEIHRNVTQRPSEWHPIDCSTKSCIKFLYEFSIEFRPSYCCVCLVNCSVPRTWFRIKLWPTCSELVSYELYAQVIHRFPWGNAAWNLSKHFCRVLTVVIRK